MESTVAEAPDTHVAPPPVGAGGAVAVGPAALSGPPAVKPPRRRKSSGMLLSALTETGEMMSLARVVVVSAVMQPRGYWGDVRDQMHAILKLCLIPLTVSCIAFGLGAVLAGLTIAYYADLPPGGTIVLLAAAGAVVASLVGAVPRRA